MFCPKCGKEISSGSKFCTYCGAKSEAVYQAPPAPTVSEPKKKKSPWKLIIIIILVIALIGAAVAAIIIFSDDWFSSSDGTKTEATSETTVNSITSDPSFTELSDVVYTPPRSHAVTDDTHTVVYYDNLLVVFTTSDLSGEAMDAIAEKVDGTVVGRVSGAIHAIQISVSESDLDELYELSDTLMEDSSVMYACPEYPLQIMASSASPDPWDDYGTESDLGNENNPAGNDWWAEAIGAYTAWEYSDRCSDINVGIIDNGFYTDHEDLDGQITIVSSYNTSDPSVPHGTHVAGIIGAKNNSVGIRGVADHAKLYCADMWEENTDESYHTVLELLSVVNKMAEYDVKVINNSWGTYAESQSGYDSSEQRLYEDLIPTAELTIVMIAQLIESGHDDMLFVQAAGNDGTEARYSSFFARVDRDVFDEIDDTTAIKLSDMDITYKMIDEHILVVGAATNERTEDGNYEIAYFSNYGDTVDIFAPGDDILSTYFDNYGNLYESWGGTSMAAPMVTGAAAFVWSLDPDLTVTEVRNILLTSYSSEVSYCGYTVPMLNVGLAAEKVVNG